jgi:hypothetical protein
MRFILKFCVEIKKYRLSIFSKKLWPIYAKMVLPFFERLNLLDCSCVRSHFGIPYEYKNGIGGILNVSFCSFCLFCKLLCIKKN